MSYKIPMKKVMIILGLFIGQAQAASYDTLPMGVNTFVFKQVLTNKIESKYDANQSDKTLMINEKFTTAKLVNISETVKTYFDELKSLSVDAYNNFSFGEFEAKAWAQVNAQGIGFGRGLTDHLTVYGSLPFYHIKTTVNFYQKSPSNILAIKNAVINSTPKSATETFVKQLTLQLPDSNAELLQSVLVNYYHYKPLGTWEKDSMGDAEIGMIYRLTDFDNYGMSATLGAVLPTGSPDDPDSLQDVSTGDGQFDSFVETNMGVGFLDRTLKFDLTTRFTYQFASNKKMRTYNDPDAPLSENTNVVREKLGNKYDATFAMTVSPTYYFNIVGSYIVSKTNQSSYDFNDEKTKNALEYGTDTKVEWLKLGFGLSTIEMYKRKQFEMPLEVVLSGQKLINAKNSADYNRFDLDVKFYF